MADLNFKLNIVPVGPTHVAILDPQGNFEPLLYNANQVYVVGENLVKYLVGLLQLASKSGFEWSPGEWTVTIAKTADLGAYIAELEKDYAPIISPKPVVERDPVTGQPLVGPASTPAT